jgi:hypothetical protein
MRYSLRTLLIAVAIGPMVLAALWCTFSAESGYKLTGMAVEGTLVGLRTMLTVIAEALRP